MSIEDFSISPKCPGCGETLPPTKMVELTDESFVVCSGCGARVNLRGGGEHGDALRDLKATFDKMKK